MSVYESTIKSLNEAIEYALGKSNNAKVQSLTVTSVNSPFTFGESALNIAKWFISYNNAQEDTDFLTDLKLQKLLYYAQGISIKYTGKTLFNEKIVAWKHGPVVKEVYDVYKKFGREPIKEDIESISINGDVEVILKDVYEEYGQFSAGKLVDMTHNESPWKKTSINNVISLEKMYDFFGR